MEEKKSWEEWLANRTLWLNISIGLAAVSVFGFFAAVIFVSYASGDYAKVSIHLDFLKTFGTALFAFLTFSTVVWRGLVGEFQAREQHEANLRMDREYRTQLLFEGYRLLNNNDDYVLGTSILESILNNSDKELAHQAMDALATGLIDTARNDKSKLRRRLINRAMKAGSELKIQTAKSLILRELPLKDENDVAYGFKAVTYENCIFSKQASAAVSPKIKTKFKYCTFKDAIIDGKIHGYEFCSFHECHFLHVSHFMLETSKFEKCDFSGTFLVEYYGIPLSALEKFPVEQSGCFYYADDPPQGFGIKSLIEHLEVRDRPTT